MARTTELNNKLAGLTKNPAAIDSQIETALELLKLYINLEKPIEEAERDDCNYAALIVSRATKEEHGQQVVDFLKLYRNKLPYRAEELLQDSVLRMEAF